MYCANCCGGALKYNDKLLAVFVGLPQHNHYFLNIRD